jgi:hypothetical protein
MAAQIVMDHTGDTRHQFEPTDAREAGIEGAMSNDATPRVADPANPAPVWTSPVDLMDSLKPDFEKRPAALSARRGLEGYARYRARNIRKD